MGTTQTQPTATAEEIRVSKSVFDLDSKADVSVVKVGTFAPVSDMKEFVARLGNDATKILQVINDGLKAYATEELAKSDAAWMTETEGENDTIVLEPFTGTLLSEERSKQLNANVINMAKLLFGYDKNMVAGDRDANRKAKATAKAQALDMILSNPAVIEALKK